MSRSMHAIHAQSVDCIQITGTTSHFKRLVHKSQRTEINGAQSVRSRSLSRIAARTRICDRVLSYLVTTRCGTARALASSSS